jgi:tRNA dimethylallyltransferase
VIVGCAASGKSELAVRVAKAVDGEVVNADSMQLYTGLDIGAAKIAPAERLGVPHHLMDVYGLGQPSDVQAYQRLARAVVDELRACGCMPVLVGGSGLYVRAVIDDVRFPPADPSVRGQFSAELLPEATVAHIKSAAIRR